MQKTRYVTFLFVLVLTLPGFYQSWHVFHYHRDDPYQDKHELQIRENIADCLIADFKFVIGEIPDQQVFSTAQKALACLIAPTFVEHLSFFKGDNTLLRAPPTR